MSATPSLKWFYLSFQIVILEKILLCLLSFARSPVFVLLAFCLLFVCSSLREGLNIRFKPSMNLWFSHLVCLYWDQRCAGNPLASLYLSFTIGHCETIPVTKAINASRLSCSNIQWRVQSETWQSFLHLSVLLVFTNNAHETNFKKTFPEIWSPLMSPDSSLIFSLIIFCSNQADLYQVVSINLLFMLNSRRFPGSFREKGLHIH